MARKWVRINTLSVICLKASHSIKAICGRHEPKIKLLAVWVKVFKRGTWHQRGKVWVIGFSREALTSFSHDLHLLSAAVLIQTEKHHWKWDQTSWPTGPSRPAQPRASPYEIARPTRAAQAESWPLQHPPRPTQAGASMKANALAASVSHAPRPCTTSWSVRKGAFF